MMLQMAYFDRGRDPVVMDIGAVLDLEDVAGGKVCALAGRVEPRDYADTAAMLDRFSPAQLLGFAWRLDSGLEGRDFATRGQKRVFTGTGSTGQTGAGWNSWPQSEPAGHRSPWAILASGGSHSRLSRNREAATRRRSLASVEMAGIRPGH